MSDQQRLDLLLARVIAQAAALDIPISRRIAPSVAINRRAKTRFGCCRSTPAGHTIELSAALCRAEDQAVCQVLAHEVLHTCPGCANHGPRWKTWAQKMNLAWGYQIRRSDRPQDLGLTDQRPVRYWVVCTRCGRRIPRMKRSPLVAHPERYRCRCGGLLRVELPHQR